MARYRINIDGYMLDVYEKEKGKSKKCALLLLGFPATLGENSLTASLTESGYCVLVPHYPGTYDSSGLFTPLNSIEMLKNISIFIERKEAVNLKNNSKVQIPKSIDLIVGYSFGAFIAVHSLSHFPSCNKALFISPALTYGKADIDMGFRENGSDFINYIRRTRPHTYRLGDDSEWHDFYNGKLNKIPKLLPKTRNISILSLIGTNDTSINSGIFIDNADIFFRKYTKVENNETFLVSNSGHSVGSIMKKTSKAALKVSNFIK
ncbi:hypothetical protein INR79_25850 [Vibrio sp. SCSIO 43132]|uniref:hypothetical protein n=1 Tax=Vibrio sp. SCSIO 43132 TaxID=2779363 RepID=UPI001CA8F4CC|nr:hypothetical protein [Vibrio sp. SCSIO 43132]UAB72681.1 hypothetical protein INR79_25850 [Vibrio sp. SCSIO 43132]